MRYLVFFMALGHPGTLQAQDTPPTTADVNITINRGLDFLAKDAIRWKQEHQCASCHHASLVVWSMREAKQRGYSVDEAVLNDLTKWLTESGDGKTSVPRPTNVPRAINTKALYFALALATDPTPDDAIRAGLSRLLNTVKDDQLEDGSWAAWPETRPPFFGDSNETMTALSTLAVTLAGSSDASLVAVQDKGVRWLAATKSDDDPQSIVMRIVLWQRLKRPFEESTLLVQRTKQRQNSDGGWSQSTEMSSDAWATGQALYALAHADVTANDPLVARAQRFLVTTQRDDGSWPMISRPTKPGDSGSNNLVPIVGGGTAWAVLGLVRSL